MKQFVITTVFVGLTLLLGFGSAAGITVHVGASGIVYSPDTVTAGAGDVIEFVIASGHSVTQSNFDNPCQPIGGAAIYSGFPSNNAIFSVTVNSSDTLWFYCSDPGHCQAGMAFVVNPPASGNTLAAYKSAAGKSGSSGTPAQVQGGVFGAPSSSSSQAAVTSATASASGGSTATSNASPPATTTSGAASATGSTASNAASGLTTPFTGRDHAIFASLLLLCLMTFGGLMVFS